MSPSISRRKVLGSGTNPRRGFVAPKGLPTPTNRRLVQEGNPSRREVGPKARGVTRRVRENPATGEACATQRVSPTGAKPLALGRSPMHWAKPSGGEHRGAEPLRGLSPMQWAVVSEANRPHCMGRSPIQYWGLLGGVAP